jgi:rubrerythrin
MENDAIAIGLKLLSLAPEEDIAQLIEITNDENDHDRIYSAILSRYQTKEGE